MGSLGGGGEGGEGFLSLEYDDAAGLILKGGNEDACVRMEFDCKESRCGTGDLSGKCAAVAARAVFRMGVGGD